MYSDCGGAASLTYLYKYTYCGGIVNPFLVFVYCFSTPGLFAFNVVFLYFYV